MKRISNKLIIQAILLILWAVPFAFYCLLTYYVCIDPGIPEKIPDLRNIGMITLLSSVLYFANFFFFDPHFNQKGSRLKYIAIILAFIFALSCCQILFDGYEVAFDRLPKVMQMFIPTALVSTALSSLLSLLQARDCLEEAQRKQTEAELSMMKYQLNPHFLFNTLNNISAQIPLNADEAQSNVTRLSDMLRYMLYESSSERVPLTKEVEFMRNYIQLMRLRCNSRAEISATFPADEEISNLMIAPLLFVSLVENAFKHGVSSRHPSFVRICLTTTANQIVFVCDNSNFPKQGGANSGIGLHNLARRLQLAYPGKYSYTHQTNTETYHAQITLNI